MNTKDGPGFPFSEQWRDGEGMLAWQHASELLSLQSDDRADRRSTRRLLVKLPLEGWLRLAGPQQALIPVALVDFCADGVGIVLQAHHGVQAGRYAELITQAHGAGCSYRTVRCCWQRPHPSHWQLQRVGLSFMQPSAHRSVPMQAWRFSHAQQHED